MRDQHFTLAYAGLVVRHDLRAGSTFSRVKMIEREDGWSCNDAEASLSLGQKRKCKRVMRPHPIRSAEQLFGRMECPKGKGSQAGLIPRGPAHAHSVLCHWLVAFLWQVPPIRPVLPVLPTYN